MSDLKYAIEYIDEQIRSNYIDLCNGINERLSNIDTSIEMQSDEIFDRKIEEIGTSIIASMLCSFHRLRHIYVDIPFARIWHVRE